MTVNETPSISIYNASAGSGKTYTLVKEYLKIILCANRDDAYRNILAITFTNKAVHEMKSRIVENLSEFAKENPNKKSQDLMKVIEEETQLSFQTIHKKSKQIIKHIIHNYAAFDISTIDKFTHKVIRAFAHDLNLPMTFEVTLDTENLLIEAVDAIIAQAGRDEQLTKLLVDFTMQKADDDKSWDISREILEIGRLALNENNRNEITHFKEKSIADFMEVKDKLLTAVQKLNSDCVDCSDSVLALIEKNGIDHKSFSRGTFPNHLGYIKRGELKSAHKRFHEFEDIAINKTATDRTLIEAIIPEMLQVLNKVYKNYEKRDFYNAFLKNITPLSLLNTVSNELAKIQKEQNILSIAEFNSIIYREIQNQPAPFIYERMGERYNHFFIDEFQDTSEMQWENLIPLIDNVISTQNEVEVKGTLMIVGDPKQSIYRWRGGKAEQFIKLGTDFNPFSNENKKSFPLDKNWRSYSQVIEFNNDFFKFIAAEFEQLDYKDLYENKSSQQINHKIGGYVNITFIPKVETADNDEEPLDKSDLYVLATLNTILEVRKKGFHYKEMVILTRKRSQGIAIANYLTEKKIPILSSETLMIANSTEVQLIIYLLRYLENARDIDSKAHFLHYLATKVQTELPIHDFIAKGMEYREELQFEEWLSGINIDCSFLNIRKKSLYEAVEIIISKFINTKDSNAYVQYFLDIVLERDMRNQAGIADFLEFWNKKSETFSIPSPEGKDAVRIMTIHKSKGLEFPVVIMPFAEEDYNRKPKDKLWLDSDETDFGLQKVLIDNSSAVSGFGDGASSIYNQKKQEELLDNINVLYVALTRAEEQLYIISNMNITTKGEIKTNDMSTFFINYLENEGKFMDTIFEYEFGDPAKLSEPCTVSAEVKNIPVVSDTLKFENIKIAQREALMWGTLQQDAIEYGNVVHEILSFVKSADDIELAMKIAIETGLITEGQKLAVTNSISEIVSHPDLKDYFSLQNKILNEQSIIQKQTGTIKPDRMVIAEDNKVFLLDYKTGTHQKKYQYQLEKYQIAIESMGYKVVKKALIYIGEKIEVVNL